MVRLRAANQGIKSPILNQLIRQTEDGGFYVPGVSIERLRLQRLRESATTAVPRTPRFLMRDLGGVASSKEAAPGDGVNLPFRALRRLRYRSPFFNVLHNACAFGFRSHGKRWDRREGSTGWQVCDRRWRDPNHVTRPHLIPYIQRVQAILDEPSARYCPNLADLIAAVGEDLLTINRPAMEVLRSNLDPSIVVGIKPIDGALIYEAADYIQHWITTHPEVFNRKGMRAGDALDLLCNIMDADLTTARHILVREDLMVEKAFEPGRIICRPVIKYTDIDFAGYPRSYIEEALELAGALWHTFKHQTNLFTEGMWAEFFLAVSGDYSGEAVDLFLEDLREATQGYKRAGRPPVLQIDEGDVKRVDLKDAPRDMVFPSWTSLLLNLLTAVYRRDPSVINIGAWEGGSGPILSAPSRSLEIALSRSEGHLSDIDHIGEMLTEFARMCHPDILVRAVTAEDDLARRADLDEKQMGVWKTPNEIRLEHGFRPKGYWVPDEQVADLSPEDAKRYWANAPNLIQLKNGGHQGLDAPEEEPPPGAPAPGAAAEEKKGAGRYVQASELRSLGRPAKGGASGGPAHPSQVVQAAAAIRAKAAQAARAGAPSAPMNKGADGADYDPDWLSDGWEDY